MRHSETERLYARKHTGRPSALHIVVATWQEYRNYSDVWTGLNCLATHVKGGCRYFEISPHTVTLFCGTEQVSYLFNGQRVRPLLSLLTFLRGACLKCGMQV